MKSTEYEKEVHDHGDNRDIESEESKSSEDGSFLKNHTEINKNQVSSKNNYKSSIFRLKWGIGAVIILTLIMVSVSYQGNKKLQKKEFAYFVENCSRTTFYGIDGYMGAFLDYQDQIIQNMKVNEETDFPPILKKLMETETVDGQGVIEPERAEELLTELYEKLYDNLSGEVIRNELKQEKEFLRQLKLNNEKVIELRDKYIDLIDIRMQVLENYKEYAENKEIITKEVVDVEKEKIDEREEYLKEAIDNLNNKFNNSIIIDSALKKSEISAEPISMAGVINNEKAKDCFERVLIKENEPIFQSEEQKENFYQSSSFGFVDMNYSPDGIDELLYMSSESFFIVSYNIELDKAEVVYQGTRMLKSQGSFYIATADPIEYSNGKVVQDRFFTFELHAPGYGISLGEMYGYKYYGMNSEGRDFYSVMQLAKVNNQYFVEDEEVTEETYNNNLKTYDKFALDKIETDSIKKYEISEEEMNLRTEGENYQERQYGIMESTSSTQYVVQNDDILPESSQRYISVDELRGLSKSNLALARNEIYARHGRKFIKEELQGHFSAKSWYKPVYEPEKFNDDFLNNYERVNILLLQSCEEGKFYLPEEAKEIKKGGKIKFYAK